MKIKALSKEERPREKALTYGIESLNNRELLALLLRTGYKGCSALDVADSLLSNFSSLKNVLNASAFELSQIRGISKVKALEIISIGELSKRAEKEEKTRLADPKDVFLRYGSVLSSNEGEKIILISLNRNKQIIREHVVSLNNESFTSISIQNSLSLVLKDMAIGFILIHNHPSGLPLPSKQDITFTDKLRMSADSLGLRFFDHIILSKNSYFSFSEEGLF